ncbi:MAG: S41 family peptidase, partial [FCB group bacterium]
MKNIKVLLIIFFLITGSLVLSASNDDYYFKINKSFEIFGAVIRELSSNYVDEIDPEDMIDDGIDGMLKNLDPYTTYIDNKDNEDLDIITNGSYSGLGITVSIRDSMLTIIDIHDGFSAQRNGVRIGDRIYKIDSVNLLHQSTDELRKYTRGKPGTTVILWVIRNGMKDTIAITLQREEIKINNVSYSGMINDSVGYIKLDRFSRFSAEEVRNALNELKRNDKFHCLILDLRDNPGGLLESAVAISEIFLKSGSPIVSTKGRNHKEERMYRSVLPPVDKDTRLAVLINRMSASASEILAGAIQDLDRGIIVGERSFGKGLVQTIFDLPYNNSLKITTAKYYTPSGRCIQRLDFHNKVKSNIDKSDSIFHTKNGRIVIESNGIMPDSLVNEKPFSDFTKQLLRDDVFFDFANDYSSELKKLPEGFQVNPKLISLFKDYINKKNKKYDTPLRAKILELEKLAKEENVSQKMYKEIENLKNNSSKENEEIFVQNDKD